MVFFFYIILYLDFENALSFAKRYVSEIVDCNHSQLNKFFNILKREKGKISLNYLPRLVK